MSKTILVTGGAGYIGSHTVVELLNSGYEVVVVDNYYNSNASCLERVADITGKSSINYEVDIRDKAGLDRVFSAHKIDAVIHFAGWKAVGESVVKPLEYYNNNVGGTITLLESMRDHGVYNIVFSSSATVYGDPERLPIDEQCSLSTTNPYGTTKLAVERMLGELANSDSKWTTTLLRYFNPVGAHESGTIGEAPVGIPNNLTPYIAQVASGKLATLNVYGGDYNTPDGTGVRDYIHVVDLAKGHVAALEKLTTTGVHTINLGTGNGYSVLEVLHAFERACGKELPYVMCPRRAGDIATCYADTTKAWEQLGWKAELDIDDMCSSLWKWQQYNTQVLGNK